MANPYTGKRKLKWTPARIKEVLTFAKTHSNSETIDHFKISSSQLYLWKKGLPWNYYPKGRSKAQRVAREFGRTQGNGAEPVPKALKVALLHLERWKAGQRAHIRRGGVDNSYDLEAEHAYRVLRGEE